jgi:hypothetical protein
MCRVIVLDFPDEWLSPRHPAPDNPPDNDVIIPIDAGVVTHVISNLSMRNLLRPPKTFSNR